MQTNYKKLTAFEAALIGWLFVGLIIVSLILFAGMSVKMQKNISAAFDIFDVHQQAGEAMDTLMFVLSIPEEFNKQFYIAFTEIAVLPSETFEVPTAIAKEFSRNLSVAMDSLSVQVAEGYKKQNTVLATTVNISQLPHDGKIMGTMIEISERALDVTLLDKSAQTRLEIPYKYIPPDFNFLEISLNKYIKVDQGK